MDTQPWFKSTQAIGALTGIAAGVVALSHFCCIYFGWCVFEKVSEAELVLALGAVASIGTSVYWLYKRWKAGLDPANPAPKLTLK
jgi:hypothetical protein